MLKLRRPGSRGGEVEMQPSRSMYVESILVQDIEFLGLPPFWEKKLRGLGIRTIGELLTEWSEEDLRVELQLASRQLLRLANEGLKNLGLPPVGVVHPHETVRMIS